MPDDFLDLEVALDLRDALLRLAARQAEPAQEAYTAAVEADSGSPEGLLGQAEMAVRSERERDAIELLDRVRRSLEARIRPPAMTARMHTLYGRAYLLAGREDAARRSLETFVLVAGAALGLAPFIQRTVIGWNPAVGGKDLSIWVYLWCVTAALIVTTAIDGMMRPEPEQ